MSSKETLEQFGSCLEGLEDPRSGSLSAQAGTMVTSTGHWSYFEVRLPWGIH